jgi:putative flippase GtrA
MRLGINPKHAMTHPVQFTRDLLSKPFGRYLVIGGAVYLFELLVIFVAQYAFNASALVAVALSFWLGLIVSFVLQKFVTFSDKRTHHKILIPQIIAVTLLVLFNFGFTLFVTKVLQDIVPAAISRTVALAITTIWNFYLYKTRIFKTDEPILD